MLKDDYHSAHRLRAGRWSATGQIYMVTTVTRDRARLFSDFDMARMLIGIMREDAAFTDKQPVGRRHLRQPA